MKRIINVLLVVCCTGLAASAEDVPEGQVFEMDEVTVYHSVTDFAPAYTREVPRLSFYESPELPRGELILALEFFDRYREAAIPGQRKWCGLLHFPVIDGKENTYLKYICLYLYNDRVFGFDPAAVQESNRRFAVPIPPGDIAEPEVLYRFAGSYVESIFPGGVEEYYEEEFEDPEDLDFGAVGYYEVLEIPPGRIAAVLDSQKGKPARELVRLIMRYSEDPNTRPEAAAEWGEPENFDRGRLSWHGVMEDLAGASDPIAEAAELVKPRWSSQARLHYVKDRIFLGEKEVSNRVLLFNIGMRIYSYHPRFGVWRTRARLDNLRDSEELAGLLNYPGVPEIARVELLDTAAVPE